MRDEVKVCGRNAAFAVAARRRSDIIRVFLTEERVPEFGSLLKWCAAERRVYRIVTADEVAKVAESIHHEGVCLVARRKPALDFYDFMDTLPEYRGPLVFLDGVQNPHNLGAVVRVAAHFGVIAILMPEDAPAALGSAATQRTAEGGFEWLDLVLVSEAGEALDELREAGFRIFATTSHTKASLYETVIPERSVFVLGAEATGLEPRLLRASDGVIAIPGTGHVESLNVATAAALVLGEAWRQQHAATPKTDDTRGRVGPRRSPAPRRRR